MNNPMDVGGSPGGLTASPAFTAQTRPAKKAFQIEKGERAAAVFCLLMGIIYARWMLAPPAVLYQHGWWTLAAVLGCFFVCIEVSARLCRIPCRRESWFWAAM